MNVLTIAGFGGKCCGNGFKLKDFTIFFEGEGWGNNNLTGSLQSGFVVRLTVVSQSTSRVTSIFAKFERSFEIYM